MPVEDFDDTLQSLIEDMWITQDLANGVGLAAPQVGVGLRVFTWNMPNEDGVPEIGAIVNPYVRASRPPDGVPDPDDESEGCLSVPGLHYPLLRGPVAAVSGFDRHGGTLEFTATGSIEAPKRRPARRSRRPDGLVPGTPGCPVSMKTPLVTDPIIALVGPTGTGKSALALDLAEALDAEIVNADASQLFRGMDIGTAKLLPSQRRGIRHHQLDVLDVTMETSVAAYQRAARADLARQP